MSIYKTIQFFGEAASIDTARICLENLPQVKRIDMVTSRKFRLFLHVDLKESELVALFKQCNLHGFCFA